MEYPQALWALLIVVPVAVFLFISGKNSRKSVLSLVGLWRWSRVKSTLFLKWVLLTLFTLLFFISAVFSLTGIRWGKEMVQEQITGLDIALVFDVSRSMLAEDIPPSRFKRALDLASAIVESGIPDRTALVAFRGKGITLVPSTEDRAALLLFLENLNIDIVTAPGTDIGDGLEAALSALPDDRETGRAVVLFSDGENQTGNLRESAQNLEKNGVHLLIAGLGSEEGAFIPLSEGRYVTNDRGERVVTRLEQEVLEVLAGYNRGELFLIEGRGSEQRIFSKLREIKSEDDNTAFRVVEKKRYRFFLLFALFMLLLMVLIEIIGWREEVYRDGK